MQMFNGISMSRMVVNEVLFDSVETKTDDVENQSTETKLQQIDESIQKLKTVEISDDTWALESLNSILNESFLNSLNENEKGELRQKIWDLLLSHIDENDYTVNYGSLIHTAKLLGMGYFSSRGEYTKNLDIWLWINWDINGESIQLLEDWKTTDWKFYENGKRVETAPEWVNMVWKTINGQLWKLASLLGENSSYKDNEWLKKASRLLENIQKIIENPIESNVQLLQQYIFDNLDNDMKDENNGNLKKTFMDKNKYNESTQKFDWKFWETTLAGLNKVLEKTWKYIDSFKDQPSESADDELLKDVKVKKDINLPEWDAQIMAADLLEGTLPDGADPEFKDGKWINVQETTKSQEVTVVVKDKGGKKLGEIKITVKIDGNKIKLTRQKSWVNGSDESSEWQEWNKSPDGGQQEKSQSKSELFGWYPKVNNISVKQMSWVILYSCKFNGADNSKDIEADWNSETAKPNEKVVSAVNALQNSEFENWLNEDVYLMEAGRRTLAVRLDSQKCLYPIAVDVETWNKIILANNPSCIAYLKNKVGNLPGYPVIAWNSNLNDYVIRSNTDRWIKWLTIEPMTIDGKWVSKSLSDCLALLNFTNLLRWNNSIDSIVFRNNNPDLKLEGDNLYVRVNRKYNKGDGRYHQVDKNQFWLNNIPDEVLRNFIKYNNGEHWEDDWDKKDDNKGYVKIQL